MGEKIKLNITTSKTILDKNSADENVIIEINENEQIQYVILAVGNFNKNITFNIKGENAEVEVIGICLLKNNEKTNLSTIQFHKEKRSNSTNLIKTILKDSANFNFTGLIKIDKKAQQTNAFLTQNTLTLSENTINHSVPSLEINADDVKASHAATTSFIDEESLYYLKSRGISQQQSENLIIRGFIQTAINKIKDEEIKKEVEEKIEEYFVNTI
jgi:Fe-S cluster assembly protein SufD